MIIPVRSSQGSSTEAPGKYLPKSTTVVTPLFKARLLALSKASLLSSLDTSGMQERTSFIAESISKPVGSAKMIEISKFSYDLRDLFIFTSSRDYLLLFELSQAAFIAVEATYFEYIKMGLAAIIIKRFDIIYH